VFGLYAFHFFVRFTPAGWQGGDDKGRVLFYQNGMMHVGVGCVVVPPSSVYVIWLAYIIAVDIYRDSRVGVL
jgi:hypothetical protein